MQTMTTQMAIAAGVCRGSPPFCDVPVTRATAATPSSRCHPRGR